MTAFYFFAHFSGNIAGLKIDRACMKELKPIYSILVFFCFDRENSEMHKLQIIKTILHVNLLKENRKNELFLLFSTIYNCKICRVLADLHLQADLCVAGNCTNKTDDGDLNT